MTEDSQSARTSWWQTVPGMLTAAAGLITAVTGLLLAVHQMGFLQHSPSAAAPTESSESRPQERPTAYSASSGHPLALPSETEIHSGEAVYKLLSADLQDYSPGRKALHLRVRMTDNGRFDANFWAASFRLLVDDALQPPLGDLDELVASHSSKDAEIVFVVPEKAATAGLQMGDVGDGKPSIPLRLTAH